MGLIKPIEDELKDFGIKNIIVVSANDSMETSHTMNYLLEVGQFDGLKTLREKIRKSKVIDEMTEEAVKSAKIETLYYRELARECSNVYLSERIYKPNELAVIVHSAGTTSEGVFERGIERGIEQGELKLSKLIEALLQSGRTEDIQKEVSDDEARKQFYREFGIID